jgi:hypothetical protein
VKVKKPPEGNSQRGGTGRETTMCISYERYGCSLCSFQCIFVHACYALHKIFRIAVRLGEIRAKKEGHRKTRALISVKVKNLQRGTANAVELGGKATVCISYVRYGALMSKQQPFFVHVSHA